MRAFNVKLILLVALFAALVVKGGQLFSAEGVQAMTRLVEKDRPIVQESTPPRPIEEEFRGLSPRPELSELAAPARKMVKSASKQVARKPGKPQPAAEAPKKPARKG
ncbi:MAG: hypothetical protein ACLGSA_11660 [Acidobacteriota bacterium]